MSEPTPVMALRQQTRGLLAAWEFLTTLRIPSSRPTTLEDLSRALPYFPLVGLLLGGLLALFDAALGGLVDRPLRDLLLLALLVVLTGGLHLDGLIDTTDGLLLDGSPAERLAAMHESLARPRGAIAGLCLLVLAYAALASIPASHRIATLLLAPTYGRWAIVLGYAAFPYARQTPGISAALKHGAHAGALASATVIALGAGLLLCWPLGVILLGGVWLLALFVGQVARRRLGGMSGDVYGALDQMAEVLTLALVPILAEHSTGLF
ncbi:MAG: adenosylcobinamide-GDP ribazoletransferase [Chloroflexi bacterium]|nr:adenosylcobinamide-GDP ribazoletransferase [Chloroflexota bacterium]